MSLFQEFSNLHRAAHPFILGNVWNVASATIMEAAGAQAIGSSSSAIADSLGYPDGEHISFEQLLFVVKHIAKKVHIPFSVDMEAGYSRDPKRIAENIKQLSDCGVVGINIEDSLLDTKRALVPAQTFAALLTEVRNILDRDNIGLFINVRVDPFITKHQDALAETLSRISAYEPAGADGIFVPLAHLENDIKAICQHTSLPVNILVKPNVPNLTTLAALGVKRISLGNGWYDSGMDHLKDQAAKLLSGNLKTIF